MYKYKIGDHVETKKCGYKGRVIETHFSCPQPPEWITHQKIPLTVRQLNENWYSILCHPSGTVVVYESDMKKIKPFRFVNPFADKYFKKNTRE